MNVAEFAAATGLGKTRVQQMCRTGYLPCGGQGGAGRGGYRIHPDMTLHFVGGAPK
jgi:hypothetical protein